MEKERNYVFDALKLFAIIMVVWGHAIADWCPVEFTSHRVFILIYSFHMPLFMTIVGFFSLSVANMTFMGTVMTKARQLLLPAFVVYSPLAVGVLIKSGLVSMINGIIIVSFWFLKCAFICFLLYFFILKLVRKVPIAIIVSLAISVFINEFSVSRMFPYFVFGIILRNIYPSIKKHAGIIALLSGIVYLGQLPFFDKDVLMVVNVSPIPKILSLLNRIDVEAIRSLLCVTVGLSGSLFFITLFEYLATKISFGSYGRKAVVLGSETLGIYMFHLYLIELPPKYFGVIEGMNSTIYYCLFTPLLTFSSIIVCHYIIKVAKSNPWLTFLILGKKYPKRYNSQKSFASMS